MKKTLEKLFAVMRWGAFDAGTRGVGLLLLLVLAALVPQGAEGATYNNMKNDRILLMNNWTKGRVKVENQGYYDTDTTLSTYWTHTGNLHRTLSTGTNHVMMTSSGEIWWQLFDCRAGAVANLADGNCIPTSGNSLQSGTGRSIVAPTAAITFRNTMGAQVLSPYYVDGVGTIYFDVVNVFNKTDADVPTIELQMATNVCEGVDKSLAEATDPEEFDWQTIKMTVLPVENYRLTGEVLEDVERLELTAPAGGKSNCFYRVRTTLNYRHPARIRIRRTTIDTTQPTKTADDIGLITLDNVVVSYPTMSFDLLRYGVDYDEDLKGAQVLGCMGDLSEPFVSFKQEGVRPSAYFKYLTNGASRVAPVLSNPRLCYRWRYLNQEIRDWKTVPLEINNVTQLVAQANTSISLMDGVGDIEYFFTADVSPVNFSCLDYTFETSVGWGTGWSEAITAITNRGSVTSPKIYNDLKPTPACGTDYFVRIRESESPFEWVKLCTSVTTNALDVQEKLWGPQDEVRMELVNTNTWRYCYYVSTNDVGRTLRFHFEGKKLFPDPENPFAYASTNHTWMCDLKEVPYLPYTSVAGEEYAHNVEITLDKESTHLIIEFNDELLSYSVSHGTYQNFNVWTDALQGYRGNAKYDEENPTNGASATGVSDTKKKFEANMADWELQGYSDPFWTEDFNTSDTVTFPLYTAFDTSPTPLNGWEAGHGQWIRGARGSATVSAPQEEVSLQMEGRGQGYVALDKESGMPAGIGTVKFMARVAQAPRFDDFAVYGDGSTLTDYAVSAQLSMSRKYEASLSPDDISPSQPSLSLVGRYREKKGCYEYRISRTASDQLTCALYKWLPSATGMAATMLASNVITSVNNAAYAKPGPGQTQIYNFQNMLVPGTKNENVKAAWTSAYLFMFTKGDGSVYIECMLSNSRNNSSITSETRSNQKKVLVYTDSNAPFLKGSYGVGSTDCNASFGAISYHLPADAGNYASGINYSGVNAAPDISADDWAFYADRWYQPKERDTEWTLGSLNATMPTNQTIRLQFKDDANGWFDSGYEVSVSSFCTNRYEFAPCVSPDYKVRLIAGGHTYDEVRTDVVVDDIEITSWRAADYPNLQSTGSYGQSKQWVYTAATLESSAEIKGPGTPTVGAAGTNGYTFAFTVPGQYTVIPQMDLVVDRVLLVGGGGAGGWTLGGGGGGGGVLEYNYETNAILLAKGSTNVVIVGGGGDNLYANSNDSSYWKQGGNGGLSRFTGKDANTGKALDWTVKGGGGGGKWGATGSSNATGGGSAQGPNSGLSGTRAAGTAGQGNSGGRAYGDRAGGGGGAALDDSGMGEDGSATKDGAGDGGDGRASDITGEIVYYGGGGGGGGGDGDRTPNSAVGGKGGLGGGGTGLDAKAKSRPDSLNGVNGLGGGGGGGSHGGSTGTNAGGKGGSGAVILRLKTSSKVCTLQPSRGQPDEAMGLRSPYLAEGLSMFSFAYANADTNCVLWLQVATNDVIEGESSMSAALTRTPPEDARWNTVAEFAFTNKTSQELFSGSCSHFMSLRAPYRGYMRLVVATNVMQYCADNEGPGRDVDYGKITITKIHCYNEPPLDMRSWWGWNLHTEGWNTPDKQYAYLFDSPDGLSASLNWSSQARENDVKKPETRGIGLSDPDLEEEYKANNSFVQCPPLMSGIGTVTFRARTFTTNQANSSWVTLYGSSEPDSYQPEVPDDWKKLARYEIKNTTYQTFKWSTTDDSTKYYAIRLEVDGSRWGRSPGANAAAWEKPLPSHQLERVWVDEITASEPIAPRIVFRDVRPFRSHLVDVPPKPVTNVMDLSEQPILGESWGIQATVEPQQMSDELITTSVVVYAAFYRGISPWGYTEWSNRATRVRLQQVASNLVFRSTYNNAPSIIGPDMTPSGVFPKSVWQYYVWAEYEDKSGVHHVHGLDSTEWQPPSWYYGIDDLNKKYGLMGIGEKFAGYTILDSISPNRAWLNEVNICDTGTYADYDNQFIEIAVPQAADLTDWRIDIVDLNVRRGTIAQFGADNAKITMKTGSRPGVDCTNHYTFVSLRSPGAKKAGMVPDADGTWMTSPKTHTNIAAEVMLSLSEGDLKSGQPYGIELVRPSGIIEHQIVIEGTNTYALNPSREYIYSGTNQLAKILAVDGEDSHWFFAGKDSFPGTLGVFKNHGEDASCWTNRMLKSAIDQQPGTPGALNQRSDGVLQFTDPLWFLQPNGTNVWIYATVLDPYVHQTVGSQTNDSTVLIIQKGMSTNIVYKTDPWYQIGDATTNDVVIAGAQGRAGRGDGHTWTLHLNEVQETIDVKVGSEPSQDIQDVGLDKKDPYYPAIMAWLSKYENDDNGLKMAELWDLGNNVVTNLDIKDMYWLNIDPVEGNWVLKAGMGTIDGAHIVSANPPTLQGVAPPAATPGAGASLQAVAPVAYEDTVHGSLTNVQMYVTMKIQKRDGSQARAPDRIQGLEPGSSSYDYDGKTNNWGSATFKICGALQKDEVRGDFYPLRWFVFGPNSFDANYRALIEISDPHAKSSPGFFNGWNDYPEIPIFYKWKLNGETPAYDTVELLKPDSTYH